MSNFDFTKTLLNGIRERINNISWNNLKDRPFYDDTEILLKWDGNIDGIEPVIGSDYNYYRICDAIPEDKVICATFYFTDGTEVYIESVEDFSYYQKDSTWRIFHNNNAQIINIQVAETDGFTTTGLYTSSPVNYPYISKISKGNGVQLLDKKYLPEHKHSWNDLTEKPFGEEVVNKPVEIFWDGDITGKIKFLDGQENGICYISDKVINNYQDLIGKNVQYYYDDTLYSITLDESMYSSEIYMDDIKGYEFRFKHGIDPATVFYNITVITDGGELYGTQYENGIYLSFDHNRGNDYIASLELGTEAQEVVKTIDTKYLPETTKYQSDWNVNDETNSAYIKNRTHYTEEENVTFIDNETIEFDQTYYDSVYTIDNLIAQEGKTYTFTIDGTSYDCVAFEFEQSILIGNLNIMDSSLENTGEPFIVLLSSNVSSFVGMNENSIHIVTNLSGESHVISLSGNIDVVRTLDEKYIPYVVGKKVEGKTFNIYNPESGNYEDVVADYGAEIFNDYEENKATGRCSHAEGSRTIASGDYSHAEGIGTNAYGSASHAEGEATLTIGYAAHAEGIGAEASGQAAHAEGIGAEASGINSHAEGYYTTAFGSFGSHAEGSHSIASGDNSHAEGRHGEIPIQVTTKQLSNTLSIVNGLNFTVYGDILTIGSYIKYNNRDYQCTGVTVDNNVITQITVKGYFYQNVTNQTAYICIANEAQGVASHVEGTGTIASSEYQHVQGKFNIKDTENKYAHIVGNGEGNTRSNAHTLDWNGNAWFAGTVEATAIILKSPNGTRFNITVGDDGVLTSTEITE